MTDFYGFRVRFIKMFISMFEFNKLIGKIQSLHIANVIEADCVTYNHI